jgi:hypothetical protein
MNKTGSLYAVSRRVGQIYSNPEVDKLRNQCLDIEEQLTKMLSEQWQKEIDRDILKSLGLEPDRNKRRKNSINKIYKNES